MLQSKRRFATQALHVIPVARVVEAAHFAKIDIANAARGPLQTTDRLLAGSVRKQRIVNAIARGERLHFGVDLVLQQGGARGGASPACFAPVDQAHVEAIALQRPSNQRARDAGADHEHIAVDVFAQRRKIIQKSVLDWPERIAAFQIHVASRLPQRSPAMGSELTD